MRTKTFSIYGLKSPEGEVRYIGATSRPLSERLQRHLYDTYRSNQQKAKWILSMRPAIPEIVPFCVGLTPDEAGELEIFFIREFRNAGHPLLNVHKGGGSLLTVGRTLLNAGLTGDERERARINFDFQTAYEQEKILWQKRAEQIKLEKLWHSQSQK